MTEKPDSQFHSPLGILKIEAREDYISSIRFSDPSDPSYLQDTSMTSIHNNNNNNDYTSSSEVLDTCRQQLSEYFEGSRKSFSVKIKPEGTEFENSVWQELSKIPYGTSISYEELAVRLGDLKKIRAAARANGKNPIPILIPCHRVIGKDGSLVGFSGGLDRKKWLLSHEGTIGMQVNLF